MLTASPAPSPLPPSPSPLSPSQPPASPVPAPKSPSPAQLSPPPSPRCADVVVRMPSQQAQLAVCIGRALPAAWPVQLTYCPNLLDCLAPPARSTVASPPASPVPKPPPPFPPPPSPPPPSPPPPSPPSPSPSPPPPSPSLTPDTIDWGQPYIVSSFLVFTLLDSLHFSTIYSSGRPCCPSVCLLAGGGTVPCTPAVFGMTNCVLTLGPNLQASRWQHSPTPLSSVPPDCL